MSFPLTATLLDPLDGSGGYPSGFTANPPFLGDTGTFQITGGSLVELTAGNGFGALAWSTALTTTPTPAAPFEVFIQATIKAATIRCGFISSLTDPTGAHAYLMALDTTTAVNNAVLESDAADFAGPVSQSFLSGNAIGLQWDGTTLSGWKGSDFSTGWVACGGGLTLTELTNPITAGWYPYLDVNMNATIALNDFGAGPFAAPSPLQFHIGGRGDC